MPMDDVQREQFQEFQMVGAHVLSHPKLLELAEAFGESAEENFNEAKKDPRKFLQSRGIDLPARWTVNVTRNSPTVISLCAGTPPHDMWCLDITLPQIHLHHL
jgi:hypothetical protein